MEKINERYKIVTLLKETHNSLIYVVDDLLLGRRVVLKMLNLNTGVIPLDYFKKEYLFNASISHPAIRRVYSFQKCCMIDSNVFAEPCYFYCADYYDEISSIDSRPELVAEFVDAVRFLHNNDFAHGDLKKNNIFVIDNSVMIIDLSPLVPHKIGIENDLEYIKSIDARSLSLPIDAQRHLRILKTHVETSYVSIRLLFPKLLHTLLSKYGTEPSVMFVENSQKEILSMAREFILEDELAGRTILHIKSLDTYSPFSFLYSLLQYCFLCDAALPLLERNSALLSTVAPDFFHGVIPSPFLATHTRLLRVFEELLAILISVNPVTLVLSWDLLDFNSRALINDFIASNSMDVRIIATSGDSNSDFDFRGQVVPALRLTRKDFDKLLRYYFYSFELHPSLTDELYEHTHANPDKLRNAILFLISNDAIFITSDNCYSLKNNIAGYIMPRDVFRQALNSCSVTKSDLLIAIYLFEKLPLSLLFELGEEYVLALEFLQKKNMVAVQHDYCYVTVGDITDIIEDFPRGDLLTKLRNYIERKVLHELTLLIPYQKILFLTHEYDLFLSLMQRIYSRFEQGSPTLKLDQVFSDCIKRVSPFISFVGERLQFFFYAQIVRLKLSDVLPIEHALETMQMIALSEEERVEYLVERIMQDQCESGDLKNIDAYFQTFNGALFNKKWRLLFNYIGYLLDRGLYQEAYGYYQQYMPQLADKLTPNMILDNIIMLSGLLGRLGRKNESYEQLLFGFSLVNTNPNIYSDTQKFKIYNNLFVYYQGEDNWEDAMIYADKAYFAAEIINDNRSLALISNNIGAFYANINNYRLSFDYFEKSCHFALKGNASELVLLTSGNLIEMYLTNCEFSKANDVYISTFTAFFDKTPVIRQKTSFLLSGLTLYFALGCTNRVVEIQQHSLLRELTLSFDIHHLGYYAVSFLQIYHQLGTPAAIDYLLSFDFSGHTIMLVCDFPPESQEKNFSTIRDMISFYIYILPELFYANDKAFVARILRYLSNYDHIITGMQNYSIIALLSMLRMWVGIETYALQDIQVGLLQDHSILMIYFYLYCYHKKNRCALWHEHALQLFKYTHHMCASVPKELIKQFVLTPKFLFYEQFFSGLQISIAHDTIKKLVRRYRSLSTAYILEHRDDYYKKAQFPGIANSDILVKKALKDALRISGFSRGIYFTYDTITGWHKEIEVVLNNWYQQGDAHVEFLMDSVLKEQHDRLHLWHSCDLSADLAVRSAAALPIFDVSLARTPRTSVTATSHVTSMHYLLALRGVFYFDTKYDLIQPQKPDMNHLFFLREYVGVALRYNVIKRDLLLDKLTGLYKRDAWTEMTKNTLPLIKNQGKGLSIMMLDIDYFKTINDTYGHKAGDVVLREVAEVTMSTLRAIDISGRYGGEEFIYCLVGVTRETALLVAERVRKNIEMSPALKKYSITVSIGLAFYPEDSDLLPDLIEKADQALLMAKRTGKNKCLYWTLD